MRWNFAMVRRGLVVAGVVTLMTAWAAYTADQVVREVGRTVAFGLKPLEINVNKASKSDRLVMPTRVETPFYRGPYTSFQSAVL